jgi:hypothetical protein
MELVVDEQYWEINWDRLAFSPDNRKVAIFIVLDRFLGNFGRQIHPSDFSFAPGFA